MCLCVCVFVCGYIALFVCSSMTMAPAGESVGQASGRPCLDEADGHEAAGHTGPCGPQADFAQPRRRCGGLSPAGMTRALLLLCCGCCCFGPVLPLVCTLYVAPLAGRDDGDSPPRAR